ncbi:hypothetical protein [Sphingopyxis witflariensis]|nr:hypothetical protein [Sphingopyxis witflariensis]
MAWDRREAIALASGLVAASALTGRAEACAITTLPFSAMSIDRQRMSSKLEALRHHWNNNSIDKFFRQDCDPSVVVDFYVDGKGGRWGAANAIDLLHECFPKILGDFSGHMFDPFQPLVYSMAVFEKGSDTPPHPPGDLRCGRSDFPPVFVIAMGFKTDRGLQETTLSRGQEIVSGLTFRASLDFDQRFYRPA